MGEVYLADDSKLGRQSPWRCSPARPPAIRTAVPGSSAKACAVAALNHAAWLPSPGQISFAQPSSLGGQAGRQTAAPLRTSKHRKCGHSDGWLDLSL